VYKWPDNKKDVTGSNFIGTGEDKLQQNNNLIAVSQPDILKFFNCIMEGVDLL
jgi:hypothetical protein